MVNDRHPRNHHHHYSLLRSFWSRNSSVGINQESINQTRPSCDGGWDAGLTQSHIRMSIRPPTASVRCGAVFPWVFTRRNREARDFSGVPRPLTTASINLLPTPRWCRECRDARLSCQDYGAYWFICWCWIAVFFLHLSIIFFCLFVCFFSLFFIILHRSLLSHL